MEHIKQIVIRVTGKLIANDLASHEWDPKHHARRCIACGGYFNQGDMVVANMMITIHYTKDCVKQYTRSARELEGKE